jgi:hypothetical protein
MAAYRTGDRKGQAAASNPSASAFENLRSIQGQGLTGLKKSAVVKGQLPFTASYSKDRMDSALTGSLTDPDNVRDHGYLSRIV